MYKKVLVAVDGSTPSLKATDTANQLMKHGLAEEVTLLCATHYSVHLPPEYFQALRDGAQQIVEQAYQRMGAEASSKIKLQVESGYPAEVILDIAKKDGYDLIIIGNRGLNQVQRLFLGSVSHKVISLAHCPVLLIK